MKCHYIKDKDAGKVFIPGCLGAAQYNDIDYCTCLEKETNKVCSKCKVAKTLDAFYIQKAGRLGRRANCIECMNTEEIWEQQREYRNRPEVKARLKEYFKEYYKRYRKTNNMKIVFVGLHNKPGLPPLCSSTVSGKIIDMIQGCFNNVEFERVNIFPVEYMPHDLEEREKLIDRFNIDDNGFYIALGKVPADSISRLTTRFAGFHHPGFAARKGKEFTQKYVSEIVSHIESVLAHS